MTGYIYDKDGEMTKLPPLISWDIETGRGEPCDAFVVCFAFTPTLLKKLAAANKFAAEHDGKTVFCGRIDEYEVEINGNGSTVSMCGRSMAALLLDNEAAAAEYTAISGALLTERHIAPYGIATDVAGTLPTLSNFTVSQGESEWSVVKRFCSLSQSAEPRFDGNGTLLLGNHDGETRKISDDSHFVELRHRDRRYGMISTLLVKNRSTGAKYGVKNQPFIDRGGSCHRIITVPKATGAEAMRYTAIYQIKESAKEKFTVTMRFAKQFPMEVGDTVKLDSSVLGLSGSFKVIRVRSFAAADFAGSEVTAEVKT